MGGRGHLTSEVPEEDFQLLWLIGTPPVEVSSLLCMGTVIRLQDVKEARITGLSAQIKDRSRAEAVAGELGCGVETLIDIAAELEKPGRDPRSDMPKPVLRSDVLSMEDLKSGMLLKGTVRNVIDFGAFVDIGVHQDGLVHISQMSDRGFVKHPLDVVSVGDVVDVRVLSVDPERKRISLTMKTGKETEALKNKETR